MSNKFQIQLPKPCHENWNKMNPVEQGRFCNSCQKAVVDFTGMSDTQLVAFFKKPSTGSVCGRFDKDQLERDLSVPGKRMPWLKYFLQLLVPTFLFACKAKSQGEPQLMGKPMIEVPKKNVKDENGNIKEEKIGSKKIKGMVTDESGVGIPSASVVIKGTNRGVVTDEKGNYAIDVEGIKSPILVFSSVGFNSVELLVDGAKQKSDLTIKLMPYEGAFMGEIVVIGQCQQEKKKNKKRNEK